jgi:hypothetical protein
MLQWRRLTNGLAIAALAFACMAADPAPDEQSAGWRKKFDEVYRLADDEVVKFIQPPFIAERNDYCRHQFTDNPNAPLATDTWSLVFRWDKGKAQFRSVSSLPGTVGHIIGSVGIEPVDLEISDDLRSAAAPGDWIVRKGVKPEQLLAKVQQILRERLDRRIKFERVKVRKEVLVASGRYEFHALPGAPWDADGGVHLFCGPNLPAQADDGNGGGTGDMANFLNHLGERAGMKVIDETTDKPKKVDYRFHSTSHDASRNANQRESLLKHVTDQTSLTFTSEEREVESWRITDEGGPVGL